MSANDFAGALGDRQGRPRRLRPRRVPGPGAPGVVLSWIGDERIAISGVPSPWAVAHLAEQGVTHVVNCRPWVSAGWYGDLAADLDAFAVVLPDAGTLASTVQRLGDQGVTVHVTDGTDLVPAYLATHFGLGASN